MNKNDYLSKLRGSLNGKVDASKVEEEINYYNDYIDSKLSNGNTFDDILSELGEPDILAKSIIMANNANASKSKTINIDNDTEETDSRFNMSDSFKSKGKYILSIILLLLIVVLIIAIIAGAISVFLPIIVPCIILWIVFRLIRRI